MADHPGGRVEVRELRIPAEDGFSLAASLFEPAGPARHLVIVASAAAVPRRYYARFAEAAARRSARVVTFDYRGVGGSRPTSLRGFDAAMRDWGLLDTPGVLAWASRTFPALPVHWVGHSYGGLATGLAHNNALVHRQLSVASTSGHWRTIRGLERYRVAFLMGGVVPPLVRVLGYFPGRWVGAEDLPRGVFLEWARWVMTPDFLFGDIGRKGAAASPLHFHECTAPLRIIRLTDDAWASEDGVRHLLARFSGSPDREIWTIDPEVLGIAPVGHLGFFRPANASPLWGPALDWLLDGAA